MSSSPFEIFRRNLKPLMVLLTILALFSFVVLPALDTYLRRGGGINSDPVVAAFDGVELTRGRVARTTQNHASVVRFLGELAERTIAMGGMPQTPGFRYDEQNGQIQALGIDANPGEEATINTLRFYSEAKKAGFELDDTAVENWIARFTDGTMSDGEVIALLMKSSGNQLGQQHLYEQLRMHLLADLYQRGSLVGLTNGQIPVVTPLGQWENFKKTSRQASVDAYGVLVSEYLDETNENPSKSEIQEVYEEGKNRINYPNDLSPAPKFRRPDSAKLQWVAADLDQFIEVEKAKLTEDQLRAEYERRLAGGDFQLPADAMTEAASELEKAVDDKAVEKTTEAEVDEEAADAKPETEDSSMNRTADTSVRLVLFQDETAAEKVTEAAKEVAEGVSEAKPKTPDQPKVEKPAPEKPKAEKPKAEKPKAEKPESKKPNAKKADAKKAEADNTADMKKDSAEKPAEKKPAEKKPADTKPADEKPAEKKPGKDEKPAESTKAVEKKDPSPKESGGMKENPEPAKPETTKKAEPADEKEPASTMKVEETAGAGDDLDLDDEPAPTKPQTFEEVRDQIAIELATQPARQALDRAVTEATKRMRRYFSERAVHESNVTVGVQTAEDAPAVLDLKSMADELGLIYGETDELANRVSAADTEPGASFGLGENFNRRGPPFSAMMFGAQLQDGSMIPAQALYSPLRTVDIEAARTYISWKTEDVASYVPELDEVRDEVIQVIRMREARTLAKAAADELAEAASVEGKSLADVIPELKKVNLISGVGPFAWLDQVGFMQTTIASVPELDAVGDEFMRAVFGTEIGDQAVASNDPQTVYYVVEPTEFQPSIDDLKEQFRQPQQRFMAQLLGNDDARNLVRGFYQSVDERTGFEFNAANNE